MQNTTQLPPGFYGLGIAPKLLQILDRTGYKIPTPIQHKSIPVALEGKDMMGIAQTGTGKTIAFTVPMIQRLAITKGMGLIIAPTRELALQIEETVKKVGGPVGLRSVVLIGGASMNTQIFQLRKKPHVIIGTPGRLNDHLDQKTLQLNHVSVLVLDEADRMLDMGFEPQIKRILEHVPKQRQTLLFSATMPPDIVGIASKYMNLPVRVEIAKAGTSAEKVSQEVFFVKKEEKIALLEKILQENRGTILVFSRTKHGAKRIARSVRMMGHTSAEIHSDRSLSQRKLALEQFKNGAVRVLVATDIAARGIDVKNIELVVNYDLPDQNEDYVHRIGRTGRAGQAGHAISFATPDQKHDVRQIERLINRPIPISKTPELPKRALTEPKREWTPEPPNRGDRRSPFARATTDRQSMGGQAGGHHTGHRTVKVSSLDQDEESPRREHRFGRRNRPYGNFAPRKRNDSRRRNGSR